MNSEDDYFALKLPLKHIIKESDIQTRIIEFSNKINKIVYHTLQFMKCYILNYYETTNKVPDISEKFILECLKMICIKETQRGKLLVKKL